jgi:hypothetical protein
MTTIDDNKGFGELRSIIHGKPGTAGWNKLVKLLDKWADKDTLTEQVIPYLAAQLGPWEQLERAGLPRWTAHALRDGRAPHPALALCDRICLPHSGLTTGQLEILLGWPQLEHMRLLEVSSASLGLGAAKLFKRATTLHHIETLDISLCPWPQSTLDLILSNPQMPCLHTLWIGGAAWQDINALHKHSPQALRALELSAQLGPAALETLWTWETRAHLTRLRIRPDAPGSLAAIVRASDVTGALESLSLESSAIHDDDLAALIERGVLRDVHTLELSNCPNLTGAALELLGRSELPALRKLSLYDTASTQREAINALLASPLLSQLRTLEPPDRDRDSADFDALWAREDVNKNLKKSLNIWLYT